MKEEIQKISINKTESKSGTNPPFYNILLLSCKQHYANKF